MRAPGALGDALRRAGLTTRAVTACFGVRAVAHVPRAVAAGRRFDARPPPAAVAPWLLVAGEPVDAAVAARALPLDDLLAAGLVARDGDVVRATVTLWPAGERGLVAADPPGARDAADAVLPPDDSSHHLAGALPRRAGRWLDVATGAAWAPLAGPPAAHVVATDVNPRAIELARVGAALSGVPLALAVADLRDPPPPGPFDLVTCNAPIPAARGERGPVHRVAAGALIERFWEVARAVLAPGGEAIAHTAVDDDPLAALAALPGEVTVARYTPAGVPGFAVTAWRPAGDGGRRVVEIALTPEAPHVTRAALV